MLLKSIKLYNFRQFIGKQLVNFSIDPNKNVTILMGENGSGKTTLAQAFTWCLYGDTDFDDKVILNKAVERELLRGAENKVRVDIDLVHSGTEYTLVREQVYKKEISGKLKALNTTFNISYKRIGQVEFVKPLEVDSLMKQILPKELARYFFFDGERIDNMSKEIKKGKSQDFAQAVRGLLGLNAFLSALEHLKPTSKYGVIGSYNQSYDSRSDVRIAEHTKTIDDAQYQIDKIENRLVDIDTEIEIANEQIMDLNIQLSKLEEAARLQAEKKNFQSQVNRDTNFRVNLINSMLKEFNKNAHGFFVKSLVSKSLEQLSKGDKLDKGIPDMHARTIEFLIDRGKCVCGTNITFGNKEYKELISALEYLPPQSIGITINQFVAESEVKAKASELVFESFANNYSTIRDYENRILDSESKIQLIEKQIGDQDKTASLQQKLWMYQKQLRDRDEEKNQLNTEKGKWLTKRDRAISERSELSLRDEKNKKIEIYKAYAQYMYDEIYKVYKANEAETRTKLQQYVNEIFKSIYEGGLSVSVDEKYNIQVLVEDEGGYTNDIETSTAQSISVIFAFISGIIKMARENSSDGENVNKLLESEPYPLVMDAPLSAFDKRRIKTVCDVLPSIAEQVIIFIKDTDGELAEQYMGSKVGKRYQFDKKNEFETNLLPR
ncbi:AAA family ATPase [Bacillus sp. FJAT-27445]|uniref:AAA family ATPase n=1 Tax=Bacillus sp. FJAT-27445 TaxID=1679166 RepID=UPI0007431D95|nr:AAA family ATPase [Bacillus sp. FJAT-27445]